MDPKSKLWTKIKQHSASNTCSGNQKADKKILHKNSDSEAITVKKYPDCSNTTECVTAGFDSFTVMGAFTQTGIRLKLGIYLEAASRRRQADGGPLIWEQKRWNDGPIAQYFHRQLESTALRAVINIEALHHNHSASATEGSTAEIHQNSGIHQALNPITQILATFKLATW